MKLSIPIVSTTEFGVQVGTRESVCGKGICREVVLSLPNLTVVETFLPLELGGVDVILGIQWLEISSDEI